MFSFDHLIRVFHRSFSCGLPTPQEVSSAGGNPMASLGVIAGEIEPCPLGGDITSRGNLQEAPMTHWHDTMVDRPETDGAVYATGWTISGLAVLGTVVAVWLLGI